MTEVATPVSKDDIERVAETAINKRRQILAEAGNSEEAQKMLNEVMLTADYLKNPSTANGNNFKTIVAGLSTLQAENMNPDGNYQMQHTALSKYFLETGTKLNEMFGSTTTQS